MEVVEEQGLVMVVITTIIEVVAQAMETDLLSEGEAVVTTVAGDEVTAVAVTISLSSMIQSIKKKSSSSVVTMTHLAQLKLQVTLKVHLVIQISIGSIPGVEEVLLAEDFLATEEVTKAENQ